MQLTKNVVNFVLFNDSPGGAIGVGRKYYNKYELKRHK